MRREKEITRNKFRDEDGNENEREKWTDMAKRCTTYNALRKLK